MEESTVCLYSFHYISILHIVQTVIGQKNSNNLKQFSYMFVTLKLI